MFVQLDAIFVHPRQIVFNVSLEKYFYLLIAVRNLTQILMLDLLPQPKICIALPERTYFLLEEIKNLIYLLPTTTIFVTLLLIAIRLEAVKRHSAFAILDFLATIANFHSITRFLLSKMFKLLLIISKVSYLMQLLLLLKALIIIFLQMILKLSLTFFFTLLKLLEA